MAYAALMEDDEAYQNATPDEKYANWFVKLPGVDQAVRIPIPFEVGYIFKALPEAVYNSMQSKQGAEDAKKAWVTIAKNVIPGGSSYGMPQAIKPVLEAAFNKSFFTGREIESRHEQQLLPEERFRENTSELAKLVGGTAGVSPVMLDHLVRGYTASMGLAFVQALGFAWPNEGPEKAVKRMSDMSVVGPFFQPTDGQGIVSGVYEKVNHLKQMKATFDEMVAAGRKADARAFWQENQTALVQAEAAGDFTQKMGKITQMEKATRASTKLTAEEKRDRLDQLRKLKIAHAKSVRSILADKT
jgi:hypothetical protein